MTQVLWEEIESHGLIVEPLQRFEQTLATLQTLRRATTFGELRGAQLPSWAKDVVEDLEMHLEDMEEATGDDDSFDYDSIAESVVYALPLPIDAENTVAWLGEELLANHAVMSGASPGGHSDDYRIRDREAFLAALRDAGFEPAHRPGFYNELQSAC